MQVQKLRAFYYTAKVRIGGDKRSSLGAPAYASISGEIG